MNEAEKVLRKIEKMTRKQFLPIIGPYKGQVLVKAIRGIHPKRVLEVGTLIGYSAILMAKELEKGAHLVTIEIYEEEAKIARENIKNAHLSATVDVIVGDAIEVIPKLTGQFDMVFLDAEKSEYIDYLRLVEDKLHKGSAVVADNVGVPENKMKEYLVYVRSSGKYRSNYVPFGEDGMEVSVKI